MEQVNWEQGEQELNLELTLRMTWATAAEAEAEQGDGFRRFVIPIAYLYHPLFQRLLEAARDTYGYSSAGPLWLPCCVDEFLRLRALVDRETAHSHSSSHRVHAGGYQ